MKKMVFVALAATALAGTGSTSAHADILGPTYAHAGNDGKWRSAYDWCALDRAQLGGLRGEDTVGPCYENPPGSDRWYFSYNP